MHQRLHVDLPVLPSPPFRRCSDLCKALLSPMPLTLPLPCPSCVPFCLRCSRPLPPPRHTVASPCTYHCCPPPPRLHMRMVPLTSLHRTFPICFSPLWTPLLASSWMLCFFTSSLTFPQPACLFKLECRCLILAGKVSSRRLGSWECLLRHVCLRPCPHTTSMDISLPPSAQTHVARQRCPFSPSSWRLALHTLHKVRPSPLLFTSGPLT